MIRSATSAAPQRKPIRELCNRCRDHLLSQVPEMPSDWDGHELRRFVAAEFSRQMTVMSLARVREYNREAAAIQAFRPWAAEAVKPKKGNRES